MQSLQTDRGRAPRRSQQERREETRAALLDATIEALVEGGYATLTLAQVTERAGLSLGAHLHHFKTRNVLLVAAVGELSQRRLAAFAERAAPIGALELLDSLWAMHADSLYQVALELWVAARTDPELRELLRGVEAEIDAEIGSLVERSLDLGIAARRVRELVRFATSAMRGLALRDYLHPERDRDAEWRACRSLLLELFENTP
ncbi:MAG: TetR family transcriptional regulator [Renibacterium sp.]|nr:TetR family transcriptional regulator [Renibacterium sp.]